jgi:rhamnosyltransferase
LHRAGIDVPISHDVPPIAPLEGMFWFRPAALMQVMALGVNDDEFQQGNADGTLYHVILRSLPYFAQAAGFLSGHVVSSSAAANHITNLSYLYRQNNLVLSGACGTTYIPVEINIGLKRSLKEYLKKHLPAILVKYLSSMYHRLRGR